MAHNYTIFQNNSNVLPLMTKKSMIEHTHFSHLRWIPGGKQFARSPLLLSSLPPTSPHLHRTYFKSTHNEHKTKQTSQQKWISEFRSIEIKIDTLTYDQSLPYIHNTSRQAHRNFYFCFCISLTRLSRPDRTNTQTHNQTHTQTIIVIKVCHTVQYLR